MPLMGLSESKRDGMPYLRGLRYVTPFAFVVIACCMLAPIVLFLNQPSPLLASLPMLVLVLVGMTMPFTIHRWFGPLIFGGVAASGILMALTGLLVFLLLGSGVVLALNPYGAPYLAVPGIVLAFGMASMLDVVLRGFLHAWMEHVGFGLAFRLAVPAVLLAVVLLPIGVVADAWLPISLVTASVVGGTIRTMYSGVSWMLSTPVLLLISMLVATW